MPQITVTSPFLFLGFILLVPGIFIILAGLGIIKFESITVVQGRRTLTVGVILTALGILFLIPDLIRTLSPTTPVPLPEVTTVLVSTPARPTPSSTETPIQKPTSIQESPTTVPSPTLIPTSSPTSSPTLLPTPSPTLEPVLLQTVCGPQAFEGDSYNSGNPFFKRTNGYISGWVTSDPSDIKLPDGSTRAIRTRYTLIVEDLPEVQIHNVAISGGHASIWGCWYRTDLTSQVRSDAEAEYVKMQQAAPAVPVKLYHIMSNGLLEEITPSSDTPEATSLPVTQQPQIISTNTAVSPKKTIVGLWERRQSGYLEHYNLQNDGSYTIEARNDGSNVIIASNYGTFTFDKNRIYSTDKDNVEFADSYYLDNGGDLLVIDNKVELAWTRIR